MVKEKVGVNVIIKKMGGKLEHPNRKSVWSCSEDRIFKKKRKRNIWKMGKRVMEKTIKPSKTSRW